MKQIAVKILITILFISVSDIILAQKRSETTIILIRHAEKDTAATNPGLSVAGKARAEKLLKKFKKLKVDEMYSTPYKRTTETLTPWAQKKHLTIKNYDAGNIKAFAAELKTRKGKTIVVAGHSNTTPALVNLLLGSEKYKPLDDSVYTKIWLLIISDDGTITEKTMKY